MLFDVPVMPRLHSKLSVGFAAFVANESNSAVMRGYVRSWIGRVFKQFDAVNLAEIY